MELFEKEMKALKCQQKRLTGYIQAVNQLQKLMEYCMEYDYDEQGKLREDENGKRIKVEPTEDNINFEKYYALKEIIEIATKLVLQKTEVSK